MARPNILRDESKVQALLNALRLGLSRGTAAKIIGCHTSTIANEAKRNRKFLDRLKEAEGNCEQALVAYIYSAAKGGQWTAAAWILERKWPQRWGRINREPIPLKEPELPDNDPPALG